MESKSPSPKCPNKFCMSPICTSFWNQKVTTVPGPPRGSICQLSYSEKAPLELFGNNSTQYFVLFVETHFVSVSEKSFSYNCLLFLHKLSKSFEILCLNWPQWPKMTTRGSSGPATHRIFSTFSFMSKYWKTKLWGWVWFMTCSSFWKPAQEKKWLWMCN